MVNGHALTVSLEEFGLSKYEAQAYVTLISKGTISAAELAYYSDIPRTKIYPTLLKLENKKLTIISKSKPIMCTAIAPEDAFDSIIDEQINKVNAMNTLVSNLKKASEESRKSRGSEEKRYFYVSANNVLEQLRIMIESSINIMVDQWGLELLGECKEQLLSVLRRNSEVRLLLPSTQICSELYRAIPNEVKIRVSDTIQNCFVFDETEVLIVDNENGKGAIFSSTEVLGVNQNRVFADIWRNSIKTESLADMTKNEAQEVYKIIRIINENGLTHILNSTMVSKKLELEMLKLLEKNGINLKSKSLDEIIEILDAILQIMCSGHVDFDANTKNITIESKLNSGHSLPWASILDECLQKQGYKTRTVYQNNSNRGEKVLIKISKS